MTKQTFNRYKDLIRRHSDGPIDPDKLIKTINNPVTNLTSDERTRLGNLFYYARQRI